jgi:cobalt-zinc-cadmium efflux system membrane fusion protein
VDYISDTIDPATRTAKLRVTVGNGDSRLKPEMFASIALAVAGHDRVVTVPSRAVFTEDGRSFVYVESAPGKFTRRAIELGSDSGDMRMVGSGLHAGEKVVVDGVLLLRGEEDKRVD